MPPLNRIQKEQETTEFNMLLNGDLVVQIPSFPSFRYAGIYLCHCLPGLIEETLEQMANDMSEINRMANKLEARIHLSRSKKQQHPLLDCQANFLLPVLDQTQVRWVESLSIGKRFALALKINQLMHMSVFMPDSDKKLQRATVPIPTDLYASISHESSVLSRSVLALITEELPTLCVKAFDSLFADPEEKAFIRQMMENIPLPEPYAAGYLLKSQLAQQQGKNIGAMQKRVEKSDLLTRFFVELHIAPNCMPISPCRPNTSDLLTKQGSGSHYRSLHCAVSMSSETYLHLLNDTLPSLAGVFTTDEARLVINVLVDYWIRDHDFSGRTLLPLFDRCALVAADDRSVGLAVQKKLRKLTVIERSTLETIGLWVRDNIETSDHWTAFLSSEKKGSL